jgi:hypothetical protein
MGQGVIRGAAIPGLGPLTQAHAWFFWHWAMSRLACLGGCLRRPW